jgi:hypothetical protein
VRHWLRTTARSREGERLLNRLEAADGPPRWSLREGLAFARELLSEPQAA